MATQKPIHDIEEKTKDGGVKMDKNIISAVEVLKLANSRGAFTITENAAIHRAIKLLEESEDDKIIKDNTNFLLININLASRKGVFSFVESSQIEESLFKSK